MSITFHHLCSITAFLACSFGTPLGASIWTRDYLKRSILRSPVPFTSTSGVARPHPPHLNIPCMIIDQGMYDEPCGIVMCYHDSAIMPLGWHGDCENCFRAVAAMYVGIEIDFTILVCQLEDGSLPSILIVWHGRGASALVLQERDE